MFRKGLARLRWILQPYSIYISWTLKLLSVLLLVAIFVFTQRKLLAYKRITLELKHLRSLRNTDVPSKCAVPQPDPWDPTILKYYAKPKPLICEAVQEQLATVQDGYIIFDKEKVQGRECYVTEFIHDEGFSDFDAIFKNMTLVDFETEGYRIRAEHEFFQVSCVSPGMGIMSRDVYKYHFAQVLPKQLSSAPHLKTAVPIEPSSPERPSVVMIGLDSMSRGNFIRQLPRTHKQMEKMGFIDMMGHVKIHDNTYGNWIAMLSGKRGVTVSEFDAEMDENWGIAYDNVEMIWNNFSKQGYATLFAEDRPDIGTFTYFGKLCGFRTSPTDHYFRTYWLAAYWSLVGLRSTPFCYDTAAKPKIQLDYLQDFVIKYRGKRQFAWWWSQDMSHDFLNVVGIVDEDFESFLVRNEDAFNETIVILFSDHGHRYDSIRETVVGRLESRLPFHSIRIPPSIREKYPNVEEMLRENSNKMTTQFDVNESLNDIAAGTFVRKSPPKGTRTRAYSYFRDIPENRTCYESQIPDEFCPCYTETEIPIKEAEQPAQVLVSSLNDMLAMADTDEYDEQGVPLRKQSNFTCQRLEIELIKYATVRLPPARLIDDPHNGWHVPVSGLEIQYRIVFQARPPSSALLEGVVVKNFNTNQWSTTGEIERNNAYGNTSHCVLDRTLKKICHCISLNIPALPPV